MRVNVYVDGFNLYYGALKRTAYKWVNIVELARQVLPASDTIQKVKYFTARVSGADDPDAPRRQQKYLSALGTLPEVEIFFGSFLPKAIWRPLLNLPVAGATIHSSSPVSLPAGRHIVSGGSVTLQSRLVVGSYLAKAPPQHRKKKRKARRPIADALIAEVHTMEEKGSDVNLAAHLINDAWKRDYEAAAVISADTDLITPIEMVTQERGLPVYIVNPGKWPLSPPLVSAASYSRHIRPAMLAASQFPDPIPGTSIGKPAGW